MRAQKPSGSYCVTQGPQNWNARTVVRAVDDEALVIGSIMVRERSCDPQAVASALQVLKHPRR